MNDSAPHIHRWLRLLSWLTLLSLPLELGCARAYWRGQADGDAAKLVREKAPGPNWHLPDMQIYAPAASRMYDPTDPDRPAMPPDDPLSHQLMHQVDGKRGYPRWHENGDIPFVDANTWRHYLPFDEQGRVVLDRDSAVLLAQLHSRSYRTEIEDLYLSALDVSFERFRFDSQFFAGNSTRFTTTGPDRAGAGGNSFSTLESTNNAQVRRLNAFGGQAVVDFANSFIWQFSGSNSETAFSIVDFSLVQPLLRFGGRARVLEQLTLAERTLLANVRQFEQYRQGFYTEVVIGHTAGDGPGRRPGISGIGGGGLGITGSPGGGNVGGFIGILQNQQQIRNQVFNVTGLRDSVAQLRALFEAGRIQSPLQVEQSRQALNSAQKNLLIAKAGYEQRLDAYKVQLGLPPDLNVLVEDHYLDGFKLIDDPINELQNNVGNQLEIVRVQRDGAQVQELNELLAAVVALRPRIEAELQQARSGYEAILPRADERRENLRVLIERPELKQHDLDYDTFRPEEFDARVARLHGNLQRIARDLNGTWLQLDEVRESLRVPPANVEPIRSRLEDVVTELSGLLLELALAQAAGRLETLTLVPVELTAEDALEVARANRRDWMNARAALVDSWRRIEFDANALKSDLNIILRGDLQTVDDQPFRFRGTTGRLQAGVEFDSPLTRLVERNNYRETLISYQRSRRAYMLFEDRIQQSLRNILRIIHMYELNFEMSRAGVIVAVKQVDLAREKLREPPRNAAVATLSPTSARDLVSALSDLLNAQNDFLNIWVNYEALRMSLDLEMGTMQLDPRGIWIDPGPWRFGEPLPTGEANPEGQLPPELLPPPPPEAAEVNSPSNERQATFASQ